MARFGETSKGVSWSLLDLFRWGVDTSFPDMLGEQREERASGMGVTLRGDFRRSDHKQSARSFTSAVSWWASRLEAHCGGRKRAP